MAGETIKEFLISLGYKVDGGSERKFVESIRKATLQAQLLADGLEALAKSTVSAVAKMADSFDALYFASKRTGASVSNIRAFQFAFSQLGGTAAGASDMIEGLAKAIRINPGNARLLKDWGINPNDDPTTNLIKQGRKYASMKHEIAVQYGELLGQSEEQVRFLRTNYKELEEKQAKAKANAKLIGLDEKKAADNSDAFNRALGDLKLTFSNISALLLSELQPVLTSLMKKFNDWITKPETINFFIDIKNAVIELGKRLGEYLPHDLESAKKSFENLKEALVGENGILGDIHKVIAGFKKMWEGLKMIRDGDIAGGMSKLFEGSDMIPKIVEGNATGDTGGGVAGAIRRAYRGAKEALGFGTPNMRYGRGGATPSGRSSGVSTEQGRANRDSWLTYAQRPLDQGGLGLTLAQARGMVAGMQGESGPNLNPGSYNKNDRGKPSGGTMQWRGDRLDEGPDGLKAFAAKRGDTSNQGMGSVETQQQFQRKEFLGKERAAFEALKSAKTEHDALTAFVEKAERPQFPAFEIARRSGYLRGMGEPPASSPSKAANSNTPSGGSSGVTSTTAPPALAVAPAPAVNSNTPLRAILDGDSFGRAIGGVGGTARILPAEVGGGAQKDVKVAPTFNTTINGFSNPEDVAHSVQREHQAANVRLQRNVQSAVA